MRLNGDIALGSHKVEGDIQVKQIHLSGDIGYPKKTYFDGAYTYDPTEEEQSIPIKGKTARDDITIEGIPSDYVGSGITRDPQITVSGKTVTAPVGYYSTSQSASVQTATPQSSIGVSVNASTGKITAEYPVPSGYIETAQTITTEYTQPTQVGQTITPTATEQTAVSAGKFTLGDVKVAPAPIQSMLMRLDAEKIGTYSRDYHIVEDESVELPEYNTTATTLLAAAALTPTITLDYANYNYYVLERFLTIPEYNVTTKAKGREEYQFSSYLYEIVELPASSMKALVDGKIYTTRNVAVIGQAHIRNLYWSSGTALAVYTATTYGVAQVAAAPTISSSTLTLNSPSVSIRGSTTYFTSTFYNALTDVRCQYVVEVYRAPKNHLNLDGWGSFQQSMHIIDCINTDTHKLT